MQLLKSLNFKKVLQSVLQTVILLIIILIVTKQLDVFREELP